MNCVQEDVSNGVLFGLSDDFLWVADELDEHFFHFDGQVSGSSCHVLQVASTPFQGWMTGLGMTGQPEKLKRLAGWIAYAAAVRKNLHFISMERFLDEHFLSVTATLFSEYGVRTSTPHKWEIVLGQVPFTSKYIDGTEIILDGGDPPRLVLQKSEFCSTASWTDLGVSKETVENFQDHYALAPDFEESLNYWKGLSPVIGSETLSFRKKERDLCWSLENGDLVARANSKYHKQNFSSAEALLLLESYRGRLPVNNPVMQHVANFTAPLFLPKPMKNSHDLDFTLPRLLA